MFGRDGTVLLRIAITRRGFFYYGAFYESVNYPRDAARGCHRRASRFH
jgi:hypothetical protein